MIYTFKNILIVFLTYRVYLRMLIFYQMISSKKWIAKFNYYHNVHKT